MTQVFSYFDRYKGQNIIPVSVREINLLTYGSVTGPEYFGVIDNMTTPV